LENILIIRFIRQAFFGRVCLFFRSTKMVLHNNQIAKLQKDSTELKAYVEEIKQKGNHSLAKKLESKKVYLDQKIYELEDMVA